MIFHIFPFHFLKLLNQALADHLNESHPKFKPQTSKRYTDFVKKAQRFVDVERDDSTQAFSQDVDMTIELDASHTQEIIPDIDPITKQKLERPVRNRICNHIYGFNSVQQTIQQNSRLR